MNFTWNTRNAKKMRWTHMKWLENICWIVGVNYSYFADRMRRCTYPHERWEWLFQTLTIFSVLFIALQSIFFSTQYSFVYHTLRISSRIRSFTEYVSIIWQLTLSNYDYCRTHLKLFIQLINLVFIAFNFWRTIFRRLTAIKNRSTDNAASIFGSSTC